MQTILGSGGIIAIELAKALKNYTEEIRLVSRNPIKVNETDELIKADLTNPDEIQKAVKGSSVVYVTIGFPYSYKSWKENWPAFISNVIQACKTTKANWCSSIMSTCTAKTI
jgi:putative NADH-flavin reductase